VAYSILTTHLLGDNAGHSARVEICTIVYIKEFRVIGEIVNGLSAFMERKNHKKIDAFKGVGVKNLLSKEEIQKTFVPKLAYVEEGKCIGCGICAEVCLNEAPLIRDKRAHVDPVKCQGCELCPQVCPVGAVTLIERKTE
jgi:dihydropyrimidine dehydrogenase (NAD+) subunit PreA